jgi:hypothetical protein
MFMTRILLALCLLLPVSAFSFENEPTGFRTNQWDTPLSQFAGVRPTGKPSGTVQNFMRLDENFPQEDIILYDIEYVADSGKFVEAVTRYECADYGTLKETLQKKYGAATAKAHKGGALIWQGKVTTITLGPPDVAKNKKPAPNAEPPLCTLTYSSTPYLASNGPKKK